MFVTVVTNTPAAGANGRSFGPLTGAGISKGYIYKFPASAFHIFVKPVRRVYNM